MLIKDDDIYDIFRASKLSIGGIGCIFKNKDIAYKITFNISAFVNNINAYFIFSQLSIPCARLYAIGTCKIDKYACFYKQITDLSELIQKCPEVYNEYIYILKYVAYDGNAYSLFSKKELYKHEDVSYFKIYIYSIIYALNNLFGIYHNDLKMDNILIRRNPSKNSINRINNIVLCNRTDWEYCINDFDMMTYGYSVNCDIKSLHESLFKLSLIENNNETSALNILHEWFSKEYSRKLVYISIL